MKKTLSFILRLGATAGIMYLILRKMDLGRTMDIIRSSDPMLMFIAFVFVFIMSFIIALRWHQIMHAYSVSVGLHRAFRVYMIAFFFNNFLPSMVGMDVVRAAYVTSDDRKLAHVASTIIIERWIGFLGIIVYLIIAPIFFIKEANMGYTFIISGVGLAMSAAFIIALTDWAYGFLSKILNKITIMKIGARVMELYDSLRLIRNHRRMFIENLFLSVVIQFSFVIINYFIVLSMHIDIPISKLIMYIPIISVVSSIPLTINGLGLREGAYMTLFGTGIMEEAVSLSLVFYVLTVIFSLLGAVYFMFEKRSTKEKK